MDQAPVTDAPRQKNYGFVIDNRKCIGCHACSVACKAENEVPLGVYRTWVKYVETGSFPNNRRHFQVTRCNHCANPPCVRICPTNAMYQREDGIVEFDNRACIGCKACIQACPYDAIHIDPETGTAAKCHYCAHRTEIGLEPACVVVCPETAIIAGDLNDPESEISRLVAVENVTVRKPEQGTSPKLFYIEGHDVALYPELTPPEQDSFKWADVLHVHESSVKRHTLGQPAGQRDAEKRHQHRHDRTAPSGAELREPQRQGAPSDGPIHVGTRTAGHMVQVSYNAQHRAPWHWPVPAYLVTKAMAAGVFMLLTLGLGVGLIDTSDADTLVALAFCLIGLGLTTVLLVADLDRPERFLYILRYPQWRSWLTRGAFVLIGFTAVVAIWAALELLEKSGIGPTWFNELGRTLGIWVGFPLALLTAIYTAFLFAQAEGRDLWQSPLLPIHLAIQAFMAGAASLLVLHVTGILEIESVRATAIILVVLIIIDILTILLGEFGVAHASHIAASAAHEIRHGRYARIYWLGSILIGHAIPIGVLVAVLILNPGGAPAWIMALMGLCVLAGLWAYEYAFVMAPQDVPNS